MLLQHRHVYTLILESHNAIYHHLRKELLVHNHLQPTQLHILIPRASQLHILIPRTHLVRRFHNQRIPHHSLLLILLHRTQHVQHVLHHLKLHPTILQVTKLYIFIFFPIDTDIHPGNNVKTIISPFLGPFFGTYPPPPY